MVGVVVVDSKEREKPVVIGAGEGKRRLT